MARALPPLTWFRSFEAAARNLSFTMAADELGLTQSAISQQVRSLELRLGVVLFIRKPRGLVLTDDGRRLLPKVGSSLDLLASATAEFETGTTGGLLTVAASVSVVRWLLAPRIGAFLTANPDLRLRVLGTIWPDEFKASLADVEIRFGSAKQVGAGAERLGPDGLIAVCGPGRKLADPVLIEAVGTSEGWRDWAEAGGVEDLRKPSLFVDSHGAALDLAACGVGTALTSSLLAADAIAAGELERAHPFRLPGTEGYYLAVTRDGTEAMAFSDWLKGTLADTETS